MSAALKIISAGETVFVWVLALVRAVLEAKVEREGGFTGPVRPRQRRASCLLDQVADLEQKGGLR